MDDTLKTIEGEARGSAGSDAPFEGPGSAAVPEAVISAVSSPEAGPSTQTQAMPRSWVRWVFVGREGLRAGWGLLIFALILGAGLAIGISVLLKLDPAARLIQRGAVPIDFKFGYLSEGSSLLAVALATWSMSKIERRSLASFGFGGSRKMGYALTGFAWGVGFLSLLVAVLWKAGLLLFDGWQMSGVSAMWHGAAWVVAFMLVGMSEEATLRGYAQATLARGLGGIYGIWFSAERRRALGFWTSAFMLSFFFGLGHRTNPGESPVGLVSAGLFGLVCCLSLWRTGSLWWAIGIHTGWDWAQSFVFGVADSGTIIQPTLLRTHPAGEVLWSGGRTGPEGSILILGVLLLMALVTWRLKRLPENAPSTTPDYRWSSIPAR